MPACFGTFFLGGRSGYFNFFALGVGKREEASEQGADGRFVIENGGGGDFRGGGVRGYRRRNDVCREGGGAKFFFAGPKRPPSLGLSKYYAKLRYYRCDTLSLSLYIYIYVHDPCCFAGSTTKFLG